MNNTTHLPRIERKAKEYAALFKYGSDYKQPAYLDGANAEFNRAAPVVKALYLAIGALAMEGGNDETVDELKQILETYKNEVTK